MAAQRGGGGGGGRGGADFMPDYMRSSPRGSGVSSDIDQEVASVHTLPFCLTNVVTNLG